MSDPDRLQRARRMMRDVVDERVEALVEAILNDNWRYGWSSEMSYSINELFERATEAYKIVLFLEDVDETDYSPKPEPNPWISEVTT